jgi:hypothetical protein
MSIESKYSTTASENYDNYSWYLHQPLLNNGKSVWPIHILPVVKLRFYFRVGSYRLPAWTP